MTKFQKRRLTLYSQLQGAEMFDALTAFRFAEQYHTGFRKDGVTPEFQHQIEIALFALLLPDLRYREETLATIALHDTREDYGVADAEIRNLFPNPERAARIGDSVQVMTKKFRGQFRDPDELFDEMAGDPIASVAKGCDRQHNFLSMVGVFLPSKQHDYIVEGEHSFLPMLKKAKRKFPYQTRAYELLKFNLESQIMLIRASLEAHSEQ